MRKIFDEILVIVIVLFFVSMNALAFLSNKIRYENIDIRKSMSTDEVAAVFNDLDGVVVRCKLNYDSFQYNKVTKNVFNDIEEIRKERVELNDSGKKYHSEKNEKINKEIGNLGYDYCYVSKYSPYIEFGFSNVNFSKNSERILKKLDKNSSISDIVVMESDTVREETLNGASIDSNSWSDFYNRYVTGNGVKIGLLETGIMDKNHVNISGSNYVIKSYLFNNKKEHATIMASLIGGNYGLACDATIYNAQAVGTINNELDWMIENDVDLINISFGDAPETGRYGGDSPVVDFYAKTYGVLFVVAAGNNGSGHYYIGNPGLGYNVMTVGAISHQNVHSAYSSSVTIEGPEKPTLMMYGDAVTVPNFSGSYEGTSAATAITTGTMAMIYEKFPTLKTQPERAIALATASTLSLYSYEIDTSNGLNDIIGAGVFRYDTMVANYSNSSLLYNQASTGGRVAYQKTIRLGGADRIKICITWFAYATGEVDETTFNDYDIKIYNSSGTLVAIGGSLDNNLEVVEYMASVLDTYTIQIYQYDTTPTTQKIGFAYQVIEHN